MRGKARVVHAHCIIIVVYCWTTPRMGDDLCIEWITCSRQGAYKCRLSTAAMANLKPARGFISLLAGTCPKEHEPSLVKRRELEILVMNWRGRRQMMLETIGSLFEFLLKNSVHRMDDGDDD